MRPLEDTQYISSTFCGVCGDGTQLFHVQTDCTCQPYLPDAQLERAIPSILLEHGIRLSLVALLRFVIHNDSSPLAPARELL